VRTDPPHVAAESVEAQEAGHVALGLIVNELVAEASRYASRHPRLAVAVGGAALLAVLRVLWLGMWWLLFAPAALYPLAGRITCGGEPIQEGNIALEPVGASNVASRTAHVTSGSFSLGKANGVVRDVEYTVRVEGFRKTGKTYPGVKPGESSEEFEQFIVPAFNRDSQTRVTMTRAVLRYGMQLDVQGTPLPEPTTPPGRNAAGGRRPAPGPPATRP
jgi:hypothetical protein